MRFLHGAIAFLLVLGPACSSGDRTLTVVDFAQNGREDVRLNEPLLFRFSLPVDPLSVGLHTLEIRDGTGASAQGGWSVAGSRVRFLPDPPEDPSLATGGLRPGRSYTVVLAGYPAHGTVRSTRGECVGRRAVFSFRTVDVAGPSGGGTTFVDPVPGAGPGLLTVNGRPIPESGVAIGREGGFTMEFTEALHPRSLRDGPIRLHPAGGDSEWVGSGPVVLLKATFVTGTANRAARLVPDSPLNPGSRYNLRYESIPFTDLTGNRIHEATLNFVSFRCLGGGDEPKSDEGGDR